MACVLAAWLAFSGPAQARIPSIERMSQPNAGKPLSFDSGLQAIEPCKGASVRLRPTWLKAARAFNLRWQVLAAITKIESAFGCNMGPSSAGAVGWTQFIPSTWERWGTDADGDGRADPHNSVDAVFSTARYLRVTGAPEDYKKAIFAYNHADWYVRDVLETAETFGSMDMDQFGELAGLTSQAQRLERQIDKMRQRRDQIRERLGERKRAAERADRVLIEQQQLLQDREQRLEQAKEQLNEMTLQYIRTTVGVSASPEQPLDDDQQVLAYLGDADPQDAVLVYGTAKNIMQQQEQQMEKMRRVSTQAEQLADQVADSVSRMEQAVVDKQAAVDEAEGLLAEQDEQIRQARTALRQMNRMQRQYAELYEQATGEDGSLEDSPFVEAMIGDIDWDGKLTWPSSGRVSSRVGMRWGRMHEGIDLAIPEGTAVRAVAEGVVSYAGVRGGYGNLVVVKHGDGMETRYAHLSRFSVKAGERVSQREVIARSGNTGHSTGPHLHFELRKNGRVLDPLRYLPKG